MTNRVVLRLVIAVCVLSSLLCLALAVERAPSKVAGRGAIIGYGIQAA